MKRISVMSAFLAALAFVAGSAAAQSTGAVRGKVIDEKGQILEGAKVEVEYQGGVTRVFKVNTNKKGEFTQVGLPPGQYKITFTKDGFQGTFMNVRVTIGEPIEMGEIKLVSAQVAQKAAAGAKAEELTGAFKAAYELMQQGKLDEAKAAYEAMLAKNPDIAQAHFNLGYIAAQKKDMAAAEAAYKKAIEFLTGVAAQLPEDGKIQYRLGVFYLSAGKYPDAAAAFEKAQQLDPENAEVHYQLGTIYVGQNNVAKAVESLEKYLSLNPTNAQNKATATALIAALKPKK